jgi:Methyltransferase domain
MRVLLGMPRYSESVNYHAAEAFFHAASEGGPVTELKQTSHSGSLLAACFNCHWALALDMYEKGQIDHFAMQHADIAPEFGWLDMLAEELLTSGADLIAAVVPIKDSRGLTSTAVDDTGNPWLVRRLTTSQVAALPVTFGDAEAGGPLLLNTGLWICKLGPWAYEVCFRIQDAIQKAPDGNRKPRVQPEDWDFSRQLHARGLKLAATRRVNVRHYGDSFWASSDQWGWDHDRQNAPRPEEQTSALPPDWQLPSGVNGWLSETEGRALARLAAGKRVLEIGSYLGLSTICMAQTAAHVTAVDTFDGRGTPEPRDTFEEFLGHLRRFGVGDRVLPLVGTTESRRHDLEPGSYGLVFVDGAHDPNNVRLDIAAAREAVAPDGLVAFHDYRQFADEHHRGWDPAVTAAVDALIAGGAELVARHETIAVLKLQGSPA